MSKRQRIALNKRTHDAEQDWEACKAWWKSESIENRLMIQTTIVQEHKDPAIERMSLMAQITLDRLLLEVWPGTEGT